jgi:hypothetical protein
MEVKNNTKKKLISNNANNIITSPKNEPEENLDNFITKIIKTYTIKYTLYIIGKRLHYLSSEGDVLYFLLDISAETDINPFDKKLLIDIQFIPNKKPYITFKKDFFIPSLCDNRNFFDCLYKKDYIYDKKFDTVEKIFDEIVHKGIKHFLFCIKDCIKFKNFIFFGDYDLKEFYNMNDFLERDNVLLYRINQVNDSVIEERYMIITQLYLLIFTPKENDKSFAKLIFKEKLHDINFSQKIIYNKFIKKKVLRLSLQGINTPIDNTYEIEFFFVDRCCPVLTELNIDENEKKENNNNIIINNEPKEEKIFKEKCDKLKEEIEKKQNEINFRKYFSVIRSCKPLFHIQRKEVKLVNNLQFQNQIIDNEKLFQFSEKAFNYYNNLKNEEKEKFQDIKEFYLIAVNLIGAELMAFYDKDKTNFNYYYDKIKSILGENEKNQ